MSLTTIFKPDGCELGYIKAIVDDSTVEFFFDLGFVANMDELKALETDNPDEEEEDDDKDLQLVGGVESYVDSGDKGSGAPDSLEWLITTVKQSTKQTIIDLTFKYTGEILSMSTSRDNLITQSLKFLKFLKESKDGDS